MVTKLQESSAIGNLYHTPVHNRGTYSVCEEETLKKTQLWKSHCFKSIGVKVLAAAARVCVTCATNVGNVLGKLLEKTHFLSTNGGQTIPVCACANLYSTLCTSMTMWERAQQHTEMKLLAVDIFKSCS
eukprot:scpid106781/ scgid9025/ 